MEETNNDDDTTIITEELIRQLEEELKTENKVLKGNKHKIFIEDMSVPFTEFNYIFFSIFI